MSDNREYISELKLEDYVSPMIEDNSVEKYRIKVLHRGEQLFYYDRVSDKAIIIEIQVRNNSVFEQSISRWDNGKKVTDAEKNVIIDRLKSYFKNYQKTEAVIR